ncbi:extended synaptotagmin-3-like [Neolamprologus brichardi]|uniref:extended synaptotagmin-3-like n=1 Tax=Neolamprologus brichardi TaxID=32507 RepID=UPI0016438B3B|nr:extended synaptotagmin-3-like [Neolamprologus brichardi]
MAQKPSESIQCTDRLSSSTVNHVIIEFVMYCGRAVFICYPVYLLGYLGINISWVLLCVFMLTYWKKNRQWKVARITSAIDLVDNEKRAIKTELRSALPMASWVQFSDVEKVHWLNKVLKQAWPFFGTYMEKLLRENIQQSIRLSSPSLKTFTFTKIHFGRIVSVFDLCSSEKELGLSRSCGCYPAFCTLKFCLLQGMMRVILEPLIGQTPLVGGVNFFFIRRPTLKINWTGMTNLLSSPAFSSLSEETIMNIIASFIVLPNRMCIPLIDQVKMDQMRFPLPRGVVRVHLLEARDLLAMDTYVMGLVKGKSDPYATLRVGNIHFKSKTVKKNLHPRWNEVYEWFPLEDVPHGEVHLKLQWFSLQTDTSLLQESNDNFACAILAVYLDNATDLPNSDQQRLRKNSKEARITKRTTFPNSFVEFSIDRNVQKSKVVYASKDPVWEEGFTFFVHDVNTQQLFVQVKEPEKKNHLGVLNLPLSRLLNISDLTLDQYFLLEHSGANSQIKLKATLRILNLEEPPPKTFINPSSEVKQQQARKTGNTSVSSPSDAPSSSHTVSSNNTPGPSTPNQETASPNQGYLAQGRGSFRASKKRKSSANVRRLTSHSLLLQNSITTSRAIRNHQGSFGEIELNVRYATLKHKLIVFIIRCRNLLPCSEHSTDSYVRLYLLPHQTWKHRKMTHVKKRMINPVFNEKFEFDVLLQEAQAKKLDVSVKNNSILVSRERKDIGSVIIDLSEMDLVKGVTAWYDLTLPELRNSM